MQDRLSPVFITYVRAQAQDLKCTIDEYELSTQFRCNGSERFVRWVSASLGLGSAPAEDFPGDEFDFRIFPSPVKLDLAIREKVSSGHSARVMAGYSLPWSAPKDDGILPNDVVVGEFARPWNAKPDAGRLAKGIPKSNLWAYQAGGIDQIGCVYTAQGFEFDYAGVTFGNDLRYDSSTGAWLADKAKNNDGTVKRSGAALVRLLQNTYKVLLSRGIMGCYVRFLDEETEVYFRSRLDSVSRGLCEGIFHQCKRVGADLLRRLCKAPFCIFNCAKIGLRRSHHAYCAQPNFARQNGRNKPSHI